MTITLTKTNFTAGELSLDMLGRGDLTAYANGANIAGGDRWPDARVDLLDRQPIVAPETLDAYAAAGWRARTVVADVLDWARADDGERWDVVVANLFLHHFEAPRLAELFAFAARCTRSGVRCSQRASRPRRAAPT